MPLANFWSYLLAAYSKLLVTHTRSLVSENMTPEELIVHLSYRPNRKRRVCEFMKQFNYYIEFSLKIVAIDDIWLVEQQLERTMSLVDVVKNARLCPNPPSFFRNMTSEELVIHLSFRPNHKRRVCEFMKQFNYCIEYGQPRGTKYPFR